MAEFALWHAAAEEVSKNKNFVAPSPDHCYSDEYNDECHYSYQNKWYGTLKDLPALEAKLKLWETPTPEMKKELKALGLAKENEEKYGQLSRLDREEMNAYNEDIST